ncbi:ABC transporter ATP-binding protein [Maribrevibacterium harenarium]|uniref:ABC-type dipeptide transporter n=1 Tax=Maribrevibacterium harenarium TaxID=2589817 RepID=A0A501X5C7_9GAMM|nr:ABC transporter ATP-binding protein [Maribrevibacterium harenarium]TPE55658.1 ABC transporter ATP-binding protein [Maribrevibacterium harenarium]
MALLTVEHLQVDFRLRQQTLTALYDISFTLSPGERLAIVGESGAGKSLLGYAIVNLLRQPGYISAGAIHFHEQNLTKLGSRQWQQIRGKKIAMIFQDPMVTLNPVLTVGEQMVEAIRAHQKISAQAAKQLAIHKLSQVKISAAEQRFEQYPHELSGGMRQRVVIAIAMLLNPEILIADEPTTALDVTIQAQILHLLKQLCEEQGVALILITHDFGVVSRIAERTLVMYAGRIVERGPTLEIINDPQHPYTQGLLNALPQMALAGQRLNQIPGHMPSLGEHPSGCAFHPRCPYATEKCRWQRPRPIYSGISTVACFAIEELLAETNLEEGDDNHD